MASQNKDFNTIVSILLAGIVLLGWNIAYSVSENVGGNSSIGGEDHALTGAAVLNLTNGTVSQNTSSTIMSTTASASSTTTSTSSTSSTTTSSTTSSSTSTTSTTTSSSTTSSTTTTTTTTTTSSSTTSSTSTTTTSSSTTTSTTSTTTTSSTTSSTTTTTSTSTSTSSTKPPTTTVPKATTTTKASSTTSTSIQYDFYAVCYTNNDCGINGTFTTKEYACYDGGIYKQYITYRCTQPGTPYAECIGTERRELLKQCGLNEGCIDWEPYCQYTDDTNIKAVWKPKNCTMLNIDDQEGTGYKGYSFLIYYVISESSKPKGIMVDIIKPDGTEAWETFVPEKGRKIDNMTIGIWTMDKTDDEVSAQVWIQE